MKQRRCGRELGRAERGKAAHRPLTAWATAPTGSLAALRRTGCRPRACGQRRICPRAVFHSFPVLRVGGGQAAVRADAQSWACGTGLPAVPAWRIDQIAQSRRSRPGFPRVGNTPLTGRSGEAHRAELKRFICAWRTRSPAGYSRICSRQAELADPVSSPLRETDPTRPMLDPSPLGRARRLSISRVASGRYRAGIPAGTRLPWRIRGAGRFLPAADSFHSRAPRSCTCGAGRQTPAWRQLAARGVPRLAQKLPAVPTPVVSATSCSCGRARAFSIPTWRAPSVRPSSVRRRLHPAKWPKLLLAAYHHSEDLVCPAAASCFPSAATISCTLHHLPAAAGMDVNFISVWISAYYI